MSGGVDAAILYPPATFRAASQGYTYLGDITDHLKNFPFAVYAANTDWAAKNRPAMLGYVKAYGRRTGNCAICGLELSAEESIQRTIGPVCASKWGMA